MDQNTWHINGTCDKDIKCTVGKYMLDTRYWYCTYINICTNTLDHSSNSTIRGASLSLAMEPLVPHRTGQEYGKYGNNSYGTVIVVNCLNNGSNIIKPWAKAHGFIIFEPLLAQFGFELHNSLRRFWWKDYLQGHQATPRLLLVLSIEEIRGSQCRHIRLTSICSNSPLQNEAVAQFSLI